MQREQKQLLAGVLAFLMVIGAIAAGATYYTEQTMAQRSEVVKTDTKKVVRKQPAGNQQATAQPARCNDGNVVGTVLGGVAGGVVGSQVGSGAGQTAATIGGAMGGAYLGNQ